MKIQSSKNGIALLITLLFVMLITLSVGVGLKHINESAKSVQGEQLMFQSSLILEDALALLKSSPQLQQITTPEHLANFLYLSEVLPFERDGIQVQIKFNSARTKINPMLLKKPQAFTLFQEFLMKREVNPVYADYVYDAMNGIREDMTYRTDLFTQNPHLFREYISSQKHLQEINSLYMKTYHDVKLLDIDMQELFFTSSDTNSTIDLNHASALTYEVILGCDEIRAQELAMNEIVVNSFEELSLTDVELENIAHFQTSFFEPYLDVQIEITQKDIMYNIRFEYNIKSKKGSHFVFEV